MKSVDEHRRYGPEDLGFAILVASDSRTLSDDDSGRLLEEMIGASGHRVVARRIVEDDETTIRQAVIAALEEARADVVVLSGGTGLSPRDVTLEALAPVIERPIEGFGELFRSLSWAQVGAAAMLSRATAGVVGRNVVFALPGSPRAVELAMRELVLPEITHLLGQIRR